MRPAPGSTLPDPVLPSEREELVARATTKADGARDALLLLMAFRIAEGCPIDVKGRIDGDRSASDYLGKELYPELGIAGVESVMQNRSFSHGYLNPEVRNPIVRELGPLAMDSSVTNEEIADIFWRLARGIAATAKVFEPLPALDAEAMTFRRVLELVEWLLAPRPGAAGKGGGSGTRGAHEQFLFAALLQAVYDDEEGNRMRVATKALTGSDKSAKTAADIEVTRGSKGRLVEAWEVTANRWDREKIDKAAKTLLAYPELERIHILADATGADASALHTAVARAAARVGCEPARIDITVLDVRNECRSLLASCSKRGRQAAIRALHAHLVDRQADMTLVGALVAKCRELGLLA